MKGFWSMIKRYVAPFKKYLAGSVVLNILSAVFNIFSFAIIVPILRILFKINETVYSFTPWDEVWQMPFKDLGDAFMANVYWTLEQQIAAVGAPMVLLYLCIFLVVMTALKTACYFGSSAVMVPIRTGVVKNIRMDIYNKILALPLGFFSEEKKGDIIARMSGDVQEVENSITGSIEMLIKNPILILFYFVAIYYMVILYSIINPIKDFAKAGYAIPKGMASMERINKILDAENDIVESKEPKTLNGFNDKLSFNHVNFRYPDGHRMILDNVSLEIPKGKTIAIVGASGAGKSTLVDLIPRFYDPTGGSITIDGTDIKDVRIADLRSLIGNVNQESILFNDTIFNNIAFGVENATMESVIEAAKIANAHEFIMEKEGGYSFNIGDRGVKLSGGQRQRISIARAILKNPPILILDEATASLDTESEKIVQEALDRLMSTRTTIAIAHRLSTIRNADEIIVMDEGRIVERGRHEQLLALNGYYRKLNDMQAL